MHSLHLLYNELRLHIILTKEYWFETVTTLAMLTFVFSWLFFGAHHFFTDNSQEKLLDEIMFGYFVWFFAISAFTAASQSLIEANQTGVISQLFLCPLGLVRLILARVAVTLVWNICIVTVLAHVTMAITNNWIKINFFELYLILIVSAPSLVGIGFIVTGLALLFKRVQTISGIFMMGCMGLVSVAAYPLNLFSLLPFSMGASLAKFAVLENNPFDLIDLLLVLINSVVYLLIGVGVYKLLERRAKKFNMIGYY